MLVRDACLAAACFGGVVALVWLGLALVVEASTAGVGALASAVPAAVVAAVWSPRLVARARGPRGERRWGANGMFVTVVAYLVGAAGVAVALSTESNAVLHAGEMYLAALLFGLVLVPLALPAGWVAAYLFSGFVEPSGGMPPQPVRPTTSESAP